jgi:hypothetical protein
MRNVQMIQREESAGKIFVSVVTGEPGNGSQNHLSDIFLLNQPIKVVVRIPLKYLIWVMIRDNSVSTI